MATETPGEAGPRDARTDAVIRQLQLLGAEMADLARRFGAAHDIDHSAARALLVLVAAAREGRDVTAGAIGRELGLSSASVTALVDRLVASGHLRRETDPRDRRRVLVRLEPSAAALGPAYFGPLAVDMADRLAGYDEHDLDVVQRFLTTALEALVAHRERDGAGRG
ncbi:MarR family winged helix-turn-helix transcriptional regulator [Jiangella sp. DSM 45060]|uniref:MarR family winged helix-turn-helix transcriptional regulator n=1 Tax=Jiangella sp. DSM 45060 TaxID=1798224 RepID=UPI00087BDAD2|nr:MarR family transcriptional regulator [Jiangella sp. DSM 45060]SDT64688.1 DNA-binding transcriptional regulator, MarR family [Jiangella sp. DSM 45060]